MNDCIEMTEKDRLEMWDAQIFPTVCTFMFSISDRKPIKAFWVFYAGNSNIAFHLSLKPIAPLTSVVFYSITIELTLKYKLSAFECRVGYIW